MTKTPQLTVLNKAYIDLSTAIGPERVPLIDVESLQTGMKFRVELTVPVGGYFYVVQLGTQDRQVHVVYPSDSGRPVSAGDALVVPGRVDWLSAVVDGPVRLVVAAEPVPAGDWPALDPGRDGDAHTPTGTEGRMVQKVGELGQTNNPPAPPPQVTNQGNPTPPKQPPANK